MARLDAEWGIDFFHLAKFGEDWKIMNVIWQTYPRAAATTSWVSTATCGALERCEGYGPGPGVAREPTPGSPA